MRKVHTITGLATVGILATTMLGAAIPASATPVGGSPATSPNAESLWTSACNVAVNKLPPEAHKQFLVQELGRAKNTYNKEISKVLQESLTQRSFAFQRYQRDAVAAGKNLGKKEIANAKYTLYLDVLDYTVSNTKIAWITTEYNNTVNNISAQYFVKAEQQNIYKDAKSFSAEVNARVKCRDNVLEAGIKRTETTGIINLYLANSMARNYNEYQQTIKNYPTKTLKQLVEARQNAITYSNLIKKDVQAKRASNDRMYDVKLTISNQTLKEQLLSELYRTYREQDAKIIVDELNKTTQYYTSFGTTGKPFVYLLNKDKVLLIGMQPGASTVNETYNYRFFLGRDVPNISGESEVSSSSFQNGTTKWCVAVTSPVVAVPNFYNTTVYTAGGIIGGVKSCSNIS